MTSKTDSNQTTLEFVKKAFDNWRAFRSRTNEPTPGYLWNMAKSLLDSIDPEVIREELKISHVQLRQHLLPAFENHNTVKSEDFVTAKYQKSEVSCEIIIQHLNGHQMHINSDQSILRQAIAEFISI
jgi:hypothetical protein